MLIASRRWCTPSSIVTLRRQWRRAASTALQDELASRRWKERFGHEGERLLRIVSRRVAGRKELLQSLYENSHLPEQIQRAKTAKELEPLSDAWSQWQDAEKSLEEMKDLLEDTDPDIRSLAREDEAILTSKLTTLVKETFPGLLIPESDTAKYSALVEIKAGVGGDESALFAAEMLRLYTRYASAQGWNSEIVDQTDNVDKGGIKEAMLQVKGEGAYDALRWENGVHRVQRVPQTESMGRIHTSTIQIMVFPIAPKNGQEAGTNDIVDEKDVRIDVMRSRGAGGQHVNKTESAVRLVHIPTGITVSMQDSRSQHQNRHRAWEILRARLLHQKLADEAEQKRVTRRSMIRSADRSEKIRTYNFPQDRITDHRIGLTLKNLEGFMDGDRLQQVIDALRADSNAAALEDLLEAGSSTEAT